MRVFVVGVGMTKFEKAGARPEWSYIDIGKEAINDALKDCKINPGDIELAVASYCYGDSCAGQRVFREIAMSSIPIINVNNNCSSGSSALYLAKQAIKGGSDCVLAFGFEKMEKGLTDSYPHLPRPLDPLLSAYQDLNKGLEPVKVADKISPMTGEVMKLFTSAGLEHIRNNGTPEKVFSLIAHKNHVHSVHNSRACFSKEIPLDDITDARLRLTNLLFTPMASPTADGGAAAVLVSEAFLAKNPRLRKQAVEIVSQEMLSDSIDSCTSFANIIGINLAREAATRVFSKSGGLRIEDVGIIELHDCYATNEFLLYEALGLCKDAGTLVLDKLEWIPTTGSGRLACFDKKFFVNPSGGLMSKGHPLGATGLAQCFEICMQIRGGVEPQRQITPFPKVGLQHNTGLGSSCVVTLYKKHDYISQSPKL